MVRTTSTFHNTRGTEASPLEYQLLHNAICEVHRRGLTHLADCLATYMTGEGIGKDIPQETTDIFGQGVGSGSRSPWAPQEPRRVATSSCSDSIGCLLDLQGHHAPQPVPVPVEVDMAPSVHLGTKIPTIPLPDVTETEKINLERKKERITHIEKKLSDEITTIKNLAEEIKKNKEAFGVGGY